MKLARSLAVFGLTVCFSLGLLAAPAALVAVRTAKARVAVFKEYFEKIGLEFVLKRVKICEESKNISVYDLTAGPNPDYKATWSDLCQANVEGVAGAISWSSDILITNQDLFMDGMGKTYRSLFVNFGFGVAGTPYSIVGSNSGFEIDQALQKKLTLKITGQAPVTHKEKLSIIIEVQD